MKKMKSQKLGLRKFLKGLLGFFVIKVLLMSTVIIYQSCETEEGLPMVKQTKDEFRNSIESARNNFSNVEVFNEKQLIDDSAFFNREVDNSLKKVDLIKGDPSNEILVSDFADLTYHMNEGMVSLKYKEEDDNHDGTVDTFVEEDCINSNGEEVCLSVYIDESQVQATLDPAIEAAREYMRSKGFTDAEIDYEVETEWGGSEAHLVPFVMYLVELSADSSTASLEFKDVFFSSLHAQSAPELTSDEIWDCAIEAVGLGFVTAASGSGLKKAGIKMLTKSFTRLVAKFAGPIGAAIMVADFGFCLYGAAND
jgi:hypothetical protein